MDDVNHLPASIRFEIFELRQDRRELRGPSGLANLEPRMYDLLLYLIEHRHRVVPTAEILDRVWKTTQVSESALPHSVSKLRRELGDAAGDSRIIKTISRVGYRFVAELVADAKPVTDQAPAKALRIALLPFENQTGEADLAWIELGLLTLVTRAITAGSGAAMVRVEDVILALATCSPDAGPDEKAQALASMLGVRRVASVIVKRNGANQFVLQWRSWLPEGPGPRGEMVGKSLTTMAGQFGVKLAEALLPTGIQSMPPPFDVADSFHNEAYARGLQAFKKEQYLRARELMNLCVRVPDHTLQIDIDFLDILRHASPAEALQRGDEFLDVARRARSPLAEAKMLLVLADAAVLVRNLERARACVAQAEGLNRAMHTEEIVIETEAKRALFAWFDGDLAAATPIMQARLERARSHGDLIDEAHALSDLGSIEAMHGDWELAQRELGQAITILRELNLSGSLLTPLVALAQGYLYRGQPDAAARYLEEALTLGQRSGSRWGQIPSISMLYRCRSELAQTEAALVLVDDLGGIVSGPAGSSMLVGYPTLFDAMMRFRRTRQAADGARTALRSEVLQSTAHGSFGAFVIALIANGDLAQAARELERVAGLYNTASASPANLGYLRAQALFHYASGTLTEARTTLEVTVGLMGGPSVGWTASIDWLWVLMDAGDLDAAAGLAAQLTLALSGTVHGRLAHARLCALRGEVARAIAIQRALNEACTGRVCAPYFAALLDYYEGRNAHFPITTPPLLPSVR